MPSESNIPVIVLVSGIIIMLIGFLEGYFFIGRSEFLAWMFIAFIGIILTILGMALASKGEGKGE